MAELITFHIASGDGSTARWCVRTKDVTDMVELSSQATTLVQARARGYCVVACLDDILAAMRSWRRHVELVPSAEHMQRARRDVEQSQQQALMQPNPMEQLARAMHGEKESEH